MANVKLTARIISVLMGAVAYAGLPILAWGGLTWAGVREFLSYPPFCALLIVLFALSIVGIFAGGNLSPGVREDRSNRWVIPAFALIGLIIAYIPAFTDRRDFWTIDGDAIRWLGVMLFAIGGSLRIWPVFVLGNRFSGYVAIQPGHTLVTNGIYAAIRHPSCLGLLMSSSDGRRSFARS